jgi:hypothetical protein
MGKHNRHLRLQRREQRRAAAAASHAESRQETTAELVVSNNAETVLPVLRVVRSEDEHVPGEQSPAGRPGEEVASVSDLPRSNGHDREEAGVHHVVAAADDGAADGADLEPAPAEAGVTRSFDSGDINPILNHPDVFKYVACKGFEPGSMDVAPLLEDQRNVLLVADGAAILFIWYEPGIYEVHTNFLKPDRLRQSTHGPYVRNVCLAAYRWMFTRTDCMILQTRIPAHNRAATVFSPLIGWTKEFERKAVWPTLDGEMVDMSFCYLRYPDWVRKTPSLMQSGRKFHARLLEERARLGKPEPPHPDEDIHDMHVGACVEMILGAQYEKAVILYNHWARFAGYAPVALIAHNPLVFDIDNAVIQMTGDTFKVIRVR